MKKLKILIIIALNQKEFVPEVYKNYVNVSLTPYFTNLIKLLEKDNEYEYYIVDSSDKLNKDISFYRNGLKYTIISNKNKYLGRQLPYIIRHYTGFRYMKKKMRRIINEYSPDIISTHGTYGDLVYCTADIDMPKLLTIDMFYDLYYEKSPNYIHKLYAKNERRVIKSYKVITYRTNFMIRKILELNPKAITPYFGYPLDIDEELIGISSKKNIDIIYAARIHKYLGVENYIELISILFKKGNRFKAKIIGGGDKQYINTISDRIINLGLSNIIEIDANIERHRDFLIQLSQARINVFPIVESMISGTVIESLAVNTPLLTFKSEVLSKLNTTRQSIIEINGNLEEMANTIERLLADQPFLNKIAENGLQTFLEQYHKPPQVILDHYKNALRTCLNL
jgi:glycosyltransferase involved in cell wall biosynthesis